MFGDLYDKTRGEDCSLLSLSSRHFTLGRNKLLILSFHDHLPKSVITCLKFSFSTNKFGFRKFGDDDEARKNYAGHNYIVFFFYKSTNG